jgi:hypothetical protein
MAVIVESWCCIDCGVNTAPGFPDGPTMRALLALAGAANVSLNELSEVYTVRNSVWARARMLANGGCLCIGCLEKRLDRRLRSRDFEPGDAFNCPDLPCTARLRQRRLRRVQFKP